MKSFWGLIPRNLIKNKKRNAFIAIGIILSMCLIISLSIMLDAFKKSSYESAIDVAGGAYDIWVSSTSADNVNDFKKDPIFTKTSICENLGLYQVPDSNYILEINGYDKNIPNFINMKLQQGRYPENDNEIAVQDWILDKLPQKYKIGDKVNLTSTLYYKNSKGNREELKIENHLKLVGIYKSTNIDGGNNKATAYVTKKYVESQIPSLLIKYGGYFMVNPKHSIEESFEALTSTNEYSKVPFSKNESKVELVQSFKIIDNVSILLYIVIAIVTAVIIYNIFNISVTERIKEFGMLRAIGSSPGQIKMLVLWEGIILGCIFIPIGIILGSFITKGIIVFVSGYKDFSSIMSIPKSGIICSTVIGFLSIFMGTYSSARRASKISPIEAISSNSNLKLTGRNIKKQLQRKSFMGKLFGFTADMAYLNLNRNRKRFVTTVVSLSISIIMFFIVTYIFNCYDPIQNLKKQIGGDFSVSVLRNSSKDSLTDKDIKDIENINGISKINKQKSMSSLYMKLPEQKVTGSGIKSVQSEAEKSPFVKQQLEKHIYSFNATLYGYTDEDISSMKKYVVQGKINTASMDNEPVVILAQNLNYRNNTKINVGDKITLYDYHYGNEKSFTVGAILDKNLLTLDKVIENIVLMSSKNAEKYMALNGYQELKISLSKNADYDEVEKSLKDKLKGNRSVNITSYKDELKNTKKMDLQTSLIAYSFVIVVAAVSIINLFNIMSMNVMLRKREIGMLRAIGFENNQVKKMIRFEGWFYGIASGLWGAGLGSVFTFLIYITLRGRLVAGMTWKFPVTSILIVFVFTTLMCLLASMNASGKLFDYSIVDSIRGND